MGVGTTIKNILSDSPSQKDVRNSKSGASRASVDSGLTNSTRETLSDGSATRADEPSAVGRQTGAQSERNRDHLGQSEAKSGGFTDRHTHGHHDANSKDIHPTGKTHEESHRLNALTHEHVRHQEVEEVVRQKEKDRHVHHVQHHVVPVHHKEEREEQHHEKIHPVTKVHEKHSNSDGDRTLLDAQVQGHKHSISHGDKERTVIDKGTIVNENVHHHTHHIIQPIIEKESVDRHRIHTVIPSQEEVHEAPIIHHSQQHAPVSMETFLSGGGALKGLAHEELGNKVLHPPTCERQVDGVGEKLARDLNLGVAEPSDAQHTNVGERNVAGRFAKGTTTDSDGVGKHDPKTNIGGRDTSGAGLTSGSQTRDATGQPISAAGEKERTGLHDPNRGMGHYNIGKSAAAGGQSGQSSTLDDQRVDRSV